MIKSKKKGKILGVSKGSLKNSQKFLTNTRTELPKAGYFILLGAIRCKSGGGRKV